MFFIVDSDDYLPDNSLEIIDKVENSIPQEQKKEFAGFFGLREHYSLGKISGASFTGKYLDITHLEKAKHNIYGEKAEIFYTEILKKYPFPEFEGEKFVTEHLVWDRMGYEGYKIRFFNEIVYKFEYQSDGLTAWYGDIYKLNPKSYGLYTYQCAKFKLISNQEKWQWIRVYYSIYKNKIKFKEIAKNLNMNRVKLFLGLSVARIKAKFKKGK